jgi:hypothetical protein
LPADALEYRIRDLLTNGMDQARAQGIARWLTGYDTDMKGMGLVRHARLGKRKERG